MKIFILQAKLISQIPYRVIKDYCSYKISLNCNSLIVNSKTWLSYKNGKKIRIKSKHSASGIVVIIIIILMKIINKNKIIWIMIKFFNIYK